MIAASRLLSAVLLGTVCCGLSLHAKQWTIPIAGNAFQTDPAPGRLPVRGDAFVLEPSKRVYAAFFRVDRPTTLELTLIGKADQADAAISVSVAKQRFNPQLAVDTIKPVRLGKIVVEKAGYVRVNFRRGGAEPEGIVRLKQLLVETPDESVGLDFVRDNQGNMFYWGRRGPSVHLSYRLPEDVDIEYAYSELTVPSGQDPIGSYFMANGFAEGYFGIQVNGPKERRVLFSVWSPFRTDNPNEIPESDRIRTLAKGNGVRAQDFGNEGSGGQSFLVYPWKAGVTYRFLTEVKPSGDGSTRYTSWFSEKDAPTWNLIASFQRPKTDTHLKRFHSFLENFDPSHGHQERSAKYGNQWVRDTKGRWHSVTAARFTGDATARGKHRLDYAGGVTEDGRFYLRNGGFFDQPTKLDQIFTCDRPTSNPPVIEMDSLPREGA